MAAEPADDVVLRLGCMAGGGAARGIAMVVTGAVPTVLRMRTAAGRAMLMAGMPAGICGAMVMRFVQSHASSLGVSIFR